MTCPYCGSTKHKIHDHRRYKCKACKRTYSRIRDSQTEKIHNPNAETRAGRIFILTCAVSSSPVNKRFLAALEHHNSVTGSQLIIAPVRYRNPTRNTEKPVDDYAREIKPYMTQSRLRLHKHLLFLSDVPIQPTNSNPLSGVETFTGQDSAIVAHPRVALKAVPTMVGSMAKLLLTTGAITEPVYSQSFAGAKGHFNHSCAAVIVEMRDDGLFDVRHIHAEKDGSFYDLDKHWCADRVEHEDIDVLVVGDLHGRNASERVLAKTFFAPDSLLKTLRPTRIVLHDVLDFDSRSHHQDYFDRFEQHIRGNSNVMQEIKHTMALVSMIASAAPDSMVHLVASNHNEHLQRWINKHEHADDLENAIVFHETRLAVLQSIKAGQRIDAFTYWAAKYLETLGNVHIMRRDESLSVNGVELGYHGDKGSGGSRGTTRGYSRIGVKVTKGHGHGPEIIDGCYSVGHCMDENEVGYIQGAPVGWMNTHCVQYKSGKRTLVNVL